MNITSINQVFRQLNRELWIVTTAFQQQRAGLVASFVSAVSIVPELPRIVVALSKQHYTWEIVQKSGIFAVHLLATNQRSLALRFGSQSGHQFDKFEGVATRIGITGSPILLECAIALECRVEESFDIGDRTLYVAEVVDGQCPEFSLSPLTQAEFIQQSSTEELAVLRNQMQADSVVDAQAIREWRQLREDHHV